MEESNSEEQQFVAQPMIIESAEVILKRDGDNLRSTRDESDDIMDELQNKPSSTVENYADLDKSLYLSNIEETEVSNDENIDSNCMANSDHSYGQLSSNSAQNMDLETSKSQESDSEEVKISKKNRELKSLLALSKEANLDTNIPHKRKEASKSKNSRNRSESPAEKRSMRSQNPEFAVKQQKFLSKVEGSSSEKTPLKKKKSSNSESQDDPQKIKTLKVIKSNKDVFCWRCHKVDVNIYCETCPRSYHSRCLKQGVSNPQKWVCPECVSIMKAESTKERSSSMKDLTLEQFCNLLKFALKQMMQVTGAGPFMNPVNEKEFPDYKNYIIQPMHLTRLEKSIKENLYGSTEAFEADAKWIMHNSIIFNSAHAKLSGIAKNILKVCRQEMKEIENCASCYLNANTKRDSWFVEVCPKPHILVWAKLKGFPYWPAKVMRCNSLGMVDVRFFGAHDRAWVPDKECFLFSLKDPNCNKQKRNDIVECIKELELHIENLKEVYGEFEYAPYRTPFLPGEESNQLKMFLPRYDPHKNLIKLDFSPKSKVKTVDSNDSKVNQNNEEQVKKKELNESLDSSANFKSFEGYGSDDEDMEPLLDKGRREEMAKRRDNEEGESFKKEEDFETQINFSDEMKTASKDVKKKTEATHTTGKSKFPKLISDSSRKRIASDEILPESPFKKSRRNSDISTKSDSSRVSNISEKIKSVDISENVEITLGNDAAIGVVSNSSEVIPEKKSSKVIDALESSSSSSTNGENRRKPIVQINIAVDENKEFNFSSQNKFKMVDKLMQKLNQSNNDHEDTMPSSLSDEIVFENEQKNDEAEVDNYNNLIDSSSNNDTESKKLKSTKNVTEENEDEIKYEENVEKGADNVNECILENEPSSSKKEENAKEEVVKSFLPSLESVSNGKSFIYDSTSESDGNGDDDDNNDCDSNDSEDDEEQLREIKKDINKPLVKNSPLNVVSSTPKSPSVINKEMVKEKVPISTQDGLMKIVAVKGLQNKNILTKTRKNNGEKNNFGNRIFKKSIPPIRLKESLQKRPQITLTSLPRRNSSTGSTSSHSSHKNKKGSVEDKTATSTNQLEPITIKSEPSSSDSETEDIEAKRKYMSALNISEKDKIITEKKSNEIRTRSKTEERSKLMNLLRTQEDDVNVKEDKGKNKANSNGQNKDPKSNSTLSKTIDDVVSHYNKDNAHVLEEGPKLKITFNDPKSRKRIGPVSLMNNSTPSQFMVQNVFLTQRKTDGVNATGNSSQHKNMTVSSTNTTPTGNTITTSKNVTSSRSLLIPRVQSDGTLVNTSTSTTAATSNNIVFVAQQPIINSLAILPPNQQINYGSGLSGTPPLLTVVQPITSTINTSSTNTIFSNICVTSNSSSSVRSNANGQESQNSANLMVPLVLNDLKGQPILNSLPSLAPLSSNYFYTFAQRKDNVTDSNTSTSSTTVTSSSSTDAKNNSTNSTAAPNNGTTNANTNNNEDWDVLAGVIPENLSQAVSELVTKGVPKLKPRPPGPLSASFDEGVPSTAGPVSARINSISHRLTDYFRGMLVELLNNFGPVEGPETEILLLKQQNEELKQKHHEEMIEIKKNISSILRDIQRSIVEERTKIIEETRASCEVETIKRIEEAKSKQWCANCFKEAQFYCCWNTSYCDYPCQQRHWLKHMSKCTQNQQQQQQQQQQTQQLNQTTDGTSTTQSNSRISNQTIMLRTSTPVNRFPAVKSQEKSALVAKPTKVYLNRGNIKSAPKMFKGPAGSHQPLTLVESSPGNYELLGNGAISVGGKIITNSTSIIQKVKNSGGSSNVALSLVPTSSVTLPVTPKLTTSLTTQQKPSSTKKLLEKSQPVLTEDSD